MRSVMSRTWDLQRSTAANGSSKIFAKAKKNPTGNKYQPIMQNWRFNPGNFVPYKNPFSFSSQMSLGWVVNSLHNLNIWYIMQEKIRISSFPRGKTQHFLNPSPRSMLESLGKVERIADVDRSIKWFLFYISVDDEFFRPLANIQASFQHWTGGRGCKNVQL